MSIQEQTVFSQNPITQEMENQMKNCFTVTINGGDINTTPGILRKYTYNNRGVYTWAGALGEHLNNVAVEIAPELLADATKCFDDRSSKTVVIWECGVNNGTSGLSQKRLVQYSSYEDEILILVRSDKPIHCCENEFKVGSISPTDNLQPHDRHQLKFERLFRIPRGEAVHFSTTVDGAYVFGFAAHTGKRTQYLLNYIRCYRDRLDVKRPLFHAARMYDETGSANRFRPGLFLLEFSLVFLTLALTLVTSVMLLPKETEWISLETILNTLVYTLGFHLVINLLRLVIKRWRAPTVDPVDSAFRDLSKPGSKPSGSWSE
ncbi:MAG: hypothetical protein K2X93_02670 [Candidatus Obscuribacterales bacterium]|nr:hypothetical protein [Candidatus Obscuribacterales bacterium]